MPKSTKKLLIYLDQNFISELAKADINDKVKQEWKDLYQLLKEGFLDEKLVVPQSWFHNIETSLAPVLKERIVSYQNYLGQVALHNAEHVRKFQTGRFLQRFLGEGDKDPFETKIAFRDPPDQRVQQFNITVDSDLSQWGFHSRRVATAAEMEAIRTEIVSKKVRYEDHLEQELSAQREFCLRNAVYYEHLCEDPARDLVAFSKDPVFRTIPVVSIYSRLWSWVFTKYPTRQIRTGDATDIDVLSTYLPYMDVIGTDAFMATQLTSLAIDKEHDVRVFNAKTSSLQAFCDFLRDYLKNTLPANRPTISVFVLPSQSVKDHAFKLFFDLAAAARQLGAREYAEIYGFDDGKMPRYEMRQMVGHKLPFYGLQDVNPINLGLGTTMEGILNVCRDHCKSDHFVLIDEYHPIETTFLLGVVMSAAASIETSDGYRIYPKKA
jgi:hypothetical protein